MVYKNPNTIPEDDMSQFINPDTVQAEPQQQEDDMSQFINPDTVDAPKQEDQSPVPGERDFGVISDMANAVNYAIEAPARGVAQGISTIFGQEERARQWAAKDLEKKKQLEISKSRSPVSTFLAGIATEGAMLVGSGAVGLTRQLVGKASGFAGKLLAGSTGTAASIGALEASKPTQEGESRLDKGMNAALVGQVAGTAAGAGGRAASSAIKSMFGNQLRAATELAGGTAAKLANVASKSKKAIMPMNPKEVVEKSGTITSTFRGTNVTKRQARKLTDLQDIRESTARTMLNKEIAKAVPEGLGKAKNARNDILSRIDAKPVPNEAREKLLENTVVAKSLKNVREGGEFDANELKELPFKELREVRQDLSNRLDRVYKGTGTGDIRSLTKAKKEVDNLLEEVAPEYRLSRAISQRIRIREKFEEAITEVGNLRGVTPAGLTQKLFSNSKKKEYLLSELEQAGVNRKGVERIIEGLKQLTRGQSDQLTSKTTEFAKNMNPLAGPGGIAVNNLTGLMDKLYANKGKVLIKMWTDPDWYLDIQRIARAKSKVKATEMTFDLIGKVVASESAKNKEDK